MLKTIIVDDEPQARTNLEHLLQLVAPDLLVEDCFGSPAKALQFLEEADIDCVFLDIEMPEMEGFAFMEALGDTSTKIIFTHDDDGYGVRALRANAIDYLLKPVDSDELSRAVQRLRHSLVPVRSELSVENYRESLHHLMHDLGKGYPTSKISLPDTHGFRIVDAESIIRIEADGRYSKLFLSQELPQLITKNLAYFEEVLSRRKFIRVHHSHIINLDHMSRFSTIDGGMAVMADQKNVLIARRRLKEFKAKVEAYYA